MWPAPHRFSCGVVVRHERSFLDRSAVASGPWCAVTTLMHQAPGRGIGDLSGLCGCQCAAGNLSLLVGLVRPPHDRGDRSFQPRPVLCPLPGAQCGECEGAGGAIREHRRRQLRHRSPCGEASAWMGSGTVCHPLSGHQSGHARTRHGTGPIRRCRGTHPAADRRFQPLATRPYLRWRDGEPVVASRGRAGGKASRAFARRTSCRRCCGDCTSTASSVSAM